VAAFDQSLQVAARELAAVSDEQLVQALAMPVGAERKAPRLQRRLGRLLALERRVRVPIIKVDFSVPKDKAHRAPRQS